jgi:hypothetical protein
MPRDPSWRTPPTTAWHAARKVIRRKQRERRFPGFFVWSPIFFSAHRIDIALGVIVPLLITIHGLARLRGWTSVAAYSTIGRAMTTHCANSPSDFWMYVSRGYAMTVSFQPFSPVRDELLAAAFRRTRQQR